METADKPPLPPTDCTSMRDVRAGVDAIDHALVALIAQRFGYMDAAARIKTDRAAVRDEARKAEVIAKVRGHAEAAGLPVDRIAVIWDLLVEQSIAHEFEQWDRLRQRA
jgi:isochorismate pyruvate lyase